MPKSLARLIALVLVPCLTADPFTAFAISGPCSPRTDQPLFQEEAIVCPVVNAERSILEELTARAAQTRMVEALNLAPVPAEYRDLMVVPMAAYKPLSHAFHPSHSIENERAYANTISLDVLQNGAAYDGFSIEDVRYFPRQDLNIRIYDQGRGRFEEFNNFDLNKYPETQRFILRRSLENPKGLEFILRRKLENVYISFDTEKGWRFEGRGDIPSRMRVVNAIEAMGLSVEQLGVQMAGDHGASQLRIVWDYQLNALEDTVIDQTQHVAEIDLNPRLAEPGFEDVLLGADFKGLVNVTTKAEKGKLQALKTYPKLFTRWVAAIGEDAVEKALVSLGDGALPLLTAFRLVRLQVIKLVSDQTMGGSLSDLTNELQGSWFNKWFRTETELAEFYIYGMLGMIQFDRNFPKNFLYVNADPAQGMRDLLAVPTGGSPSKQTIFPGKYHSYDGYDARRGDIQTDAMLRNILETGAAYEGVWLGSYLNNLSDRFYVYNPRTKRFHRGRNHEKKEGPYIFRRGVKDPGRVEAIPYDPDAWEGVHLIWNDTAERQWRDSTTNKKLGRAVNQALAKMGIKPQLANLLRAKGINSSLTFKFNPTLEAAEYTLINRKKGAAEVQLNPRLLEPGFEEDLLEAIIQGLGEVTKVVPSERRYDRRAA